MVITGRRAELGRRLEDEIGEQGARCVFVEADHARAEDCSRVVQRTLAEFGRVDILFNNAGIVPSGTVLDTPVEVWHDTLLTNVTGVFYMSRVVLPHMIARGKGAVINTASDWGIIAGQNVAAYSASKGAVIQLTRAMALDHGRQGIRVNAVCPGDTYVERWRTDWRGGHKADFDAYLKGLGDAFPLGRVGQVNEIARAVLFLASDDSSFMTGAALVVDGGGAAD